MSAVQALQNPKFLRKTTLRDTEANTNFKMLDNDIGEAITSEEADRVTPLMSKIYTRLLLTPDRMREADRVLRFAGEEREGKWLTAWEQLRGHLRVSGETASKALRWMHEQGIIGYYSGKNGVGIRIFLNRAAGSVAKRQTTRTQKILPFARASAGGSHTSPDEAPFNDSFAVREILEPDVNSRAPKNGADDQTAFRISPEPPAPAATHAHRHASQEQAGAQAPGAVSLEDVVTRLRAELEPAMHAAARQAAAREHERTREWLENRGLPKAARVAQHEAYNVLRKYGVIGGSARGGRAHAEVGRGESTPHAPHALSQEEVEGLAHACVAMLETRGQSIELTLSEMSAEGGGFLLPEDAVRVREKANSLLYAGDEGEGE